MRYSISIATYNRRKLLERNLNNLEKLTYNRDHFEVIVVDDGSSDSTEEFIREYISTSSLNIKFLRQENSGKHKALRSAVGIAQGLYFINCDSDDYLDAEALEKLDKVWAESEDLVNYESIAGVIGLNAYISNHNVIGDKFPQDGMISDPIDMRFTYKVRGDKFVCVKTSILAEYIFPDVAESVKFIPESYVLYGICSRYRFIYSNLVYKYCDYLPTGLSNNIQKYRLNNPYGCYLAYKRYVSLIPLKKSYSGYIRNYINYVRFALHCDQKIEFKYVLDPAIGLSVGYLLFIKDKLLTN